MKIKLGKCLICSKWTLFSLVYDPTTIRNHATCVRCKSSSRNRHITKFILEEFQIKKITSLSDFKLHPKLSIFNCSTRTPIAKALGVAPNIICSEYFDDTSPGEYRNGVLNQDLQKLTFSNNTINLVISEDVFEHIPDYKTAFKEVHRVLKIGGVHIFSIPFYFDNKTQSLFQTVDNKIFLTEPIEYHGDPVRGQIPCYHHLGYDLIDFLKEIGFEVRIELSKYKDIIDFRIFDSYTIITKKIF